MRDSLLERIRQFSHKDVMVIGDCMIDEYIYSSIDRISPEAPVPVAKVQEVSPILGGAANVASNLAALGVKAHLVTIVGQDTYADMFRQLCEKLNIHTDGVVTDPSRPTIVKTRVMARNQHIIRLDREDDSDVKADIENQIIDSVQRHMSHLSAVIISDYAKGVVTERVAKEIIALGKNKNIPVLVDPRPKQPEKYEGAFLVKANKQEIMALNQVLFGVAKDTPEAMGNLLRQRYGSHIVMTLAGDGMILFENDETTTLPAYAEKVVDVCGAGDSCIAGMAAGIAGGASLREAAVIGSLCSGVVVAKPGTATCSQAELEAAIKRNI